MDEIDLVKKLHSSFIMSNSRESRIAYAAILTNCITQYETNIILLRSIQNTDPNIIKSEINKFETKIKKAKEYLLKA